jgi:hypothetical protein
MSNKKFTPFSTYQKIEMARKSNKKEDGTPLKSIYAKNHNMFMNAVPTARNAMDSGFITGGGEGKRVRPIINKNKDDKQEEQKKVNLTEEQQTAVTNAGKAISGMLGG